MFSVRRGFGLSLVAALSLVALGCGGAGHEPPVCPDGDELQGECAGVPQGPVCDGDTCTAGVDCNQTLTADSNASLAAAIGSASAGTCIALKPGAYEAASLPGGVSLLGTSADAVSVEGITLAAGIGAVVRGLTVGAGGIQVDGAEDARIEAVHVVGAASTGIHIAEGSSLTVTTSTIEGGARFGLAATRGTVVTVEQTIFADNQGPGIWAACDADCACPINEKPEITLHRSFVRSNHIGGVVLFAAKMAMDAVDVTGTLPGDSWSFGLGGGGISAASCSSLTATALRVLDSTSYGVLIDDSSAAIGSQAMDQGAEISGNVIGFWAQHISQSEDQTVALENATLDANAGVGIGVDGDSQGLIICRSAVSGTALLDLPVAGASSEQVGDGLLWLGASELTVSDLSLGGNARSSILIDGEATGSLTNVTLKDGDENKGIVQQSYSSGPQPAVETNAPAITTNADEVFSIPIAPAVIPRNL